ncbi:MAG: hypothetical protein WDN44_12910 [Sphingomonas sp.]
MVLVAEGLAFAGDTAALDAGIRARARSGGVLVEEIAALPSDGPVIAVRVRLSGAEKAVLALVDGVERGTPLIRLRAWRLSPTADGGVRLTAKPWRCGDDRAAPRDRARRRRGARGGDALILLPPGAAKPPPAAAKPLDPLAAPAQPPVVVAFERPLFGGTAEPAEAPQGAPALVGIVGRLDQDAVALVRTAEGRDADAQGG